MTIASDLADYPPGGSVKLSGAGWEGDVEVRIVVNDTYRSSSSRDVNVAVAEDGTVNDSFTLPSWFVSDYNVKATGLQTERVAVAAFTDNIPVDFRQCANEDAGYPVGDCHWIGSIVQGSNADYVEGMSVPQRTIFTAVPETPGNVHTLTFDHDATASGTHAFDFLTSWDQAEEAAGDYGRALELERCGPEPSTDPQGYLTACTNVTTGPGSYYRDVAVPDDPFVSGLFGQAATATASPRNGSMRRGRVRQPDNTDLGQC